MSHNQPTIGSELGCSRALIPSGSAIVKVCVEQQTLNMVPQLTEDLDRVLPMFVIAEGESWLKCQYSFYS